MHIWLLADLTLASLLLSATASAATSCKRTIEEIRKDYPSAVITLPTMFLTGVDRNIRVRKLVQELGAEGFFDAHVSILDEFLKSNPPAVSNKRVSVVQIALDSGRILFIADQDTSGRMISYRQLPKPEMETLARVVDFLFCRNRKALEETDPSTPGYSVATLYKVVAAELNASMIPEATRSTIALRYLAAVETAKPVDLAWFKEKDALGFERTVDWMTLFKGGSSEALTLAKYPLSQKKLVALGAMDFDLKGDNKLEVGSPKAIEWLYQRPKGSNSGIDVDKLAQYPNVVMNNAWIAELVEKSFITSAASNADTAELRGVKAQYVNLLPKDLIQPSASMDAATKNLKSPR